ncbi:MAG: cupin domain-containing protein [Bifidobacteriaceae bacterium]|nr:cupin domain-containing protein [Bifidobacteriaceae bacterium]
MSVAYENMSDYAKHVVDTMNLEAHPEGGWYIRDWEADELNKDKRPLASLIYFLLPQGDASAWHKVDADEIWLWHGPTQLKLQLGGTGDKPAPDSECETVLLGNNLTAQSVENRDSAPVGHALIPKGVWQRTIPADGDVLVSCVVSPAFVFEGFELED